MTEPLLGLLSATDFISGEKLCAELKMTRGAVWKRMEKLRDEGYQIISGGKKGYRLGMDNDSLLPGYIDKELKTCWAGRGVIEYRAELTSTNTRLRELARENAPHGSVVVCDLQTGGKGRLGRAWQVERGEALTFSLLLRPQLPAERAQLCTLAMAVAVSQAIQDLCPSLHPGIKWPNDVVLDGRKCVGILSELSANPDGVEYVVTGAGVNLNQLAFEGDLTQKATSLRMELKQLHGDETLLSRRRLLCLCLERMEQAMDALVGAGLSGILPDYLNRSVTLGAQVQVTGTGYQFVGMAESLDETGALLVRDEQGELRRVLSGDVSVRGLMGYV
ncbi:MAG: biotin--[acetyl-CoA-carboxylase] ligase [Eubacteriales bacterium]|nr:biotin--[acetyl-CoA-carboxylase] ligase [Eubacteriales bacterium]